MADALVAADVNHLDISGYEDGMMWRKHTGSNEADLTKRGFFPYTRYACILNRPRVLDENTKVADTPTMDFSLVTTETEEISEDEVYALYNQVW